MKLPFTKSALEAKQASCVKLSQHLTDAKAALAKQESTVARLAEDGASDKELKTALDAKRDAEDLVKTRSKAHADAVAEVEALKAEEIRLANEKNCNEAGDKLEDVGNTFLKDIDGFGLALGRVIISAGRVRENIPHDGGLADLFVKLQTEIPVSVKMNLSELRLRVAAVRAGHATVTEPAPAPAPIALAKPADMTPVCTLKAVAYLDATGMVATAARGTDIALNPQIAKHAIAINACCAMDDARRRTARERQGLMVGKPLRRNCVELQPLPPDNEAEPFAPESVMRSAPPNTPDPRFQIIDRGPRYDLQVARNLDTVARNNKDNET